MEKKRKLSVIIRMCINCASVMRHDVAGSEVEFHIIPKKDDQYALFYESKEPCHFRQKQKNPACRNFSDYD